MLIINKQDTSFFLGVEYNRTFTRYFVKPTYIFLMGNTPIEYILHIFDNNCIIFSNEFSCECNRFYLKTRDGSYRRTPFVEVSCPSMTLLKVFREGEEPRKIMEFPND